MTIELDEKARKAAEDVLSEIIEAEPWFGRFLYWKDGVRMWSQNVNVTLNGDRTFNVQATIGSDCVVDCLEVRAVKDHRLLATYPT